MKLLDINSDNHPIWPLLRLVVILGFLTLVLYLNASEFDETELKVIGWMFMGFLGREFIPSVAKKVKDTFSGEHKSD